MTLNDAIERLEFLCRAGDADTLRLEMFAEDAAVSGEGTSAIAAGPDLLAMLAEMLRITPLLSIRVSRMAELSADSAVTWLEWTSPTAEGTPGETLAFRSLTAWKRRGAGWVVAADMYAMGSFSH